MQPFKNITFIVLLLFVHLSMDAQRRVVTGVVSDSDGEPIIGANILALGTVSGAVSDIDGSFKLIVPDSAYALQISFTGYATQTFKLNEENDLDITLKEPCYKCYLDHRARSLYLKSGLLNMPIGIDFKSSIPIYLGSPTLKVALGYQTNRQENSRLNTQVMLDHISVNCDFDFSLKTSYSSTQYNNQLSAQRLDLYTTLIYSRTQPILGFSRIEFDHLEDSFTSSGTVLGLKHSIYAPIYMDIEAVTHIYSDLMEYEMTVTSIFRGVLVKLNYYQVSEFRELTLGFGINL